MIEIKEDRVEADLNCWGRKWNINFEPAKCHSLCVSLKHDIDYHPPIFIHVSSLPIEEVNYFKITFDCKLTLSNMIEHILLVIVRGWEHCTELRITGGLAIAFKALSGLFVSMEMLCLWVLLPLICPNLMEYSDWPRDQVSTFPTLSSRHSASAIGLLCKILASCCQDPL